MKDTRGWNRPTNAAVNPAPGRRVRAVFVLAAMAAVAVALYCLPSRYSTGNEPGTPKGEEPSRSVGACRSSGVFAARTPAVMTAGIEKPTLVEAAALLQTEKRGRVVTWPRPDGRLFSNDFESFAQDFVTFIPGERFIEVELNESFDEAFMASLTNEISVSEGDADDVAEIKSAVAEIKEEVRRQLGRGRKPHEVMAEARAEINKIADFRDNLQKAFNELVLTAKSPSEIVEYCEEANRMLKEYGAFPIEGATTEEEAQELHEILVEHKRQDEEAEQSKLCGNGGTPK